MDIVTIAKWEKDAWYDIPEEVVKSFKKCCISNAMDGSGDDAVYEVDSEIEVEEDQVHLDMHMTEAELQLFRTED